MRIFVHGFPGLFGGACTECWHTAKLWRRGGVDVTFLPTGSIEPEDVERVESIGCEVIQSTDPKAGKNLTVAELEAVDGLPGSIVVSFCNAHFLNPKKADFFRSAKCKRIWLNCMTWAFPAEKKIYERGGLFDRFVFQSKYQRGQLEKVYKPYGYKPEQGRLIHGAFDIGEFPFRPLAHKSRSKEPLIVGRLSRPDRDKWSSNTWPIILAAHHDHNPTRGRVMGWEKKLLAKLKQPPKGFECLRPKKQSAQEFLQSLHVYCQVNGGAHENWSRTGLEAMATGVPLVVQNQWGWKEMVVQGETGYLCSDELADFATHIAILGYDEGLRMRLAENARRRVEELSDPDTIWVEWDRMFKELSE